MIRVIIERRVKGPQEVARLLHQLRIVAMSYRGYISGETLVNHYDSRTIAVISTWQTIDDWIRWEESDERAASEAELENLLEEPAKFEIYDLGESSKL